MPTTQQLQQGADIKQDKREAYSALIGEQVLHAIGTPAGLYMVQVRPLWENFYRVNVFVGVDAASAKVARSYFVRGDNDGNIVTANPKITKQY